MSEEGKRKGVLSILTDGQGNVVLFPAPPENIVRRKSESVHIPPKELRFLSYSDRKLVNKLYDGVQVSLCNPRMREMVGGAWGEKETGVQALQREVVEERGIVLDPDQVVPTRMRTEVSQLRNGLQTEFDVSVFVVHLLAEQINDLQERMPVTLVRRPEIAPALLRVMQDKNVRPVTVLVALRVLSDSSTLYLS